MYTSVFKKLSCVVATGFTTIVLASSASAAWVFTPSTVDSVSDLQPGIYAVAGNVNGATVNVGGNTFIADPQTGLPVTFSNGGVVATVDGLSFGGLGNPFTAPNTGDSSIDSLLGGYLYGFNSVTINVTGLTGGSTYGLDLLFYTNGSTTLGLDVEGDPTTFDPFSNTTANGVLIHAVGAVSGDGILNVTISGDPFQTVLNAFSVSPVAVPEPSSALMLALGTIGMLRFKRKRAS